MSSFKFESDKPFSAHIGSTFATGDATITLAALYGDKIPKAD